MNNELNDKNFFVWATVLLGILFFYGYYNLSQIYIHADGEGVSCGSPIFKCENMLCKINPNLSDITKMFGTDCNINATYRICLYNNCRGD